MNMFSFDCFLGKSMLLLLVFLILLFGLFCLCSIEKCVESLFMSRLVWKLLFEGNVVVRLMFFLGFFFWIFFFLDFLFVFFMIVFYGVW